jgi:hypothetical protein
VGALAAEAERAPREQEAERRGRVVDAVDVRLRRSESCVGASVELRQQRTCGDRGCAERRRWRERNDDTGARAVPQRRKKREAHTRAVSGRIPACGNAVAERRWRRRGGSVRRNKMTADHSGEA